MPPTVTPSSASTPAADGSPTFRLAARDDLPCILRLLDDDAIAAARHAPAQRAPATVAAAFEAIEADPNNELWVAELAGDVVAVLQLTTIPGLSRNGMQRALVEAVRVRADLRGRGIGQALMQQAIARARDRGCGLLQLTTDRRREAAQRFYLRLGFVASHVGMKLAL